MWSIMPTFSKIFGQFTQVVVSLYWVYYWTIIQQCMLVVDNFHVKIRYTYTHFFHMFFKSCVGFVLSNCLNVKKIHLGIRNTQFSIAIERSRTTKCIQYNLHDTKSCELPNCNTFIWNIKQILNWCLNFWNFVS